MTEDEVRDRIRKMSDEEYEQFIKDKLTYEVYVKRVKLLLILCGVSFVLGLVCIIVELITHSLIVGKLGFLFWAIFVALFVSAVNFTLKLHKNWKTYNIKAIRKGNTLLYVVLAIYIIAMVIVMEAIRSAI